MPNENERRERLAELLNEVAVDEGIHPTLVEGVRVARHSSSLPRTAVVYEPAIVIVGQGCKRSYLANQVFEYGPADFLVLSVPLPVECEWDASPQEPVLVLGVKIDPTTLAEMILEMDEPLSPLREMPRAMTTHPLSDPLSSSVIRLLECLKCPLDSRMLGRQLVREIVYRVIREEKDGALQVLAHRNEHFMRIARVLKEVHVAPSKPFTVEGMSKRAGMSTAAFHHNFKLVTGNSPLQYLKRIRLDQAKRLMIHDGYNASTAARAVGYESASQFSREYKRQFGVTPMEGVETVREERQG